MFNRLLPLLTAVALTLPVAAVGRLVTTPPPSAKTVPHVKVKAAGVETRLAPDDIGVSRDAEGLLVDEELLIQRLQDVVADIGTPAIPGGYELTDSGPVVKKGRAGLSIDFEKTRDELLEAMRNGEGDVEIAVSRVEAAPPPDFLIVVRLSDFRLELYKHTELVKHWAVGVGALKFPTPPGAYFIRSKAANPTWRNPYSSWSRTMPARIGPGPKNPLGTRALRLDRGALVIHGTPQPWTVGRRSSHGCMRMRNPEVEELFDMVPVGTQVFIIP